MDAIFSTSQWDMAAMLKFNDIDAHTQNHLVRVYGALAMTMLAAVVGTYAEIVYNVAGANYGLAGLCALGVSFWILVDRSDIGKPSRVAKLGLFGFLDGVTLAPLIHLTLQVDPSILVTALLASVAVFVSFSLCALLSKRRSFLFLFGPLSSFISTMLWLRLINWFVPIPFMFSLELYGGLFAFMGYILLDTQVMIERRSQDFVMDALQLFVDLVAVFVRILIILLKNKGNEKKNERRNRR